METAKKLIATLKKDKLSLALAESVSAGYASFCLTKVPGSSKVFKGGLVVYSLDTKNILFKIPQSTLKKTQGVSKDIALKLAEKVKKKLKADIGAAVVGFAGPSTKKGVKVGTSFIAVSYKAKNWTKKLILKGNRNQIRKKASQALIKLIYESIHCY